MLQASIEKRNFIFSFKARTSRGLMPDKTSWFINVWDSDQPQCVGIGECGPLPKLSIDDRPDLEQVLETVVENINEVLPLDQYLLSRVQKIIPAGFPSITFALETALLDLLHGGKRIIYPNSFMEQQPISINGLIWMGDMDFMMHQIQQKVASGFRCIKLKVGGLDFDRECDVLCYIRQRYFREDLIIRLDANGAFKIDDAMVKLHQLEKFNIHSIEQPIKPGHTSMEELCRTSPIPIALDEELIGVDSADAKEKLLLQLKPSFIVLKPTLHGGLTGTHEWITLAEKHQIGWWITSALESNVGLNAICQLTANYNTTLPQGLGTGMIYTNNIDSPLTVEQGTIFYDTKKNWGNL